MCQIRVSQSRPSVPASAWKASPERSEDSIIWSCESHSAKNPISLGSASDVYSRAFVEIIPAPESVGPLLERLAARYRLAVLSNTDRDLLDASLARIGVEFEQTIVASEIISYKPAPVHWDEFFARSGADRDHHVHVAASLFHDIAPASALGLRTIWINRLGEEAEPQPDLELHSLAGLADNLDLLVP